MPPIRDNQVLDPGSASIDAPSIVTSLNTDTGPAASASSFGASAQGLAAGLDAFGQNVGDLARQRTAADGHLWAAQQATDLDKVWSVKVAQAAAIGQPIDPDHFDNEFQQDVQKRLSSAPSDFAAQSFQVHASNMGLGLFKQNLAAQAQITLQNRERSFVDVASNYVTLANSGQMSYEDAAKAITGTTAAVKPVLPTAPSIADQAHADLATGQITAVARTQGPDQAAAALRSGDLGGKYVDPITRETTATTLDNQAQNDISTRVALAQKTVDDLNSKIANGQPVTPQEQADAATNLQQAKGAQVVDSKPPSLVDSINDTRARWNDMEANVGGQFSGVKFQALKQMETNALGQLVRQRFVAMTPSDMRAQVAEMANTYGNEDPVVRTAAQLVSQIEEKVVPGRPGFDPAAVAVMRPDVQTKLADAQSALAAAQTPQDIGVAQQKLQIAAEASFAAQRQMGVPDNKVQLLTNDQAQQWGAGADSPDAAKKLVSNMTALYGQYAPQAIKQVFGQKGSVSGAVQLAMLNPGNDSVWAAAQFSDKLDAKADKDKQTIQDLQSALKGNDTFNQYFQAQQTNFKAADTRVDYASGLTQMAHYRMQQYGEDAKTAMNAAVANTIGAAFSATKTSNGHYVSLPSTVAANPSEVSSIQDKANIALTTIQQQAAGMLPSPGGDLTLKDTSPAGQKLDQNVLWHQVLQNGYWAYDPAAKTLTRYRSDPRGDAPVMLADGRTLAFDAEGLKASVPIQEQYAIDGSGQRMTLDDFKKSGASTAPLNPAKPITSAPLFPSYQRLDSDLNSLMPAIPAPAPTGPILKGASAPAAAAGPTFSPGGAPVTDASQIERHLEGSLRGYGSTFVDAGTRFGVDPALLASIAMHETGHGSSKALREGSNAMGVSDAAGPVSFASRGGVPASIFKMAQRLGQSPIYQKARQAGTIDALGSIYAPVGAENDPRGLNGGWAAGVSGNYQKMRS